MKDRGEPEDNIEFKAAIIYAALFGITIAVITVALLIFKTINTWNP